MNYFLIHNGQVVGTFGTIEEAMDHMSEIADHVGVWHVCRVVAICEVPNVIDVQDFLAETRG